MSISSAMFITKYKFIYKIKIVISTMCFNESNTLHIYGASYPLIKAHKDADN
jgi:hypothetical protein